MRSFHDFTQRWARRLATSAVGAAVVLTGGSMLAAERAEACGGFFCDAAQPINQSAEQIIFVSHEDNETVTMVVRVQYQGPAENFSWLLPVPGIPEIDIASSSAFQTLLSTTNPQMQVTTEFIGNCEQDFAFAGGDGGGDGDGDGDGEIDSPPNVQVVDSGAVGPYDYEVISVNPELADPAQVAIDWLTENGYDIGELGPEVLRDYLEDGLNLLAFRLQSSADVGDIRPIVMTMAGTHAMIPIRPTAVAADPDMGVIVWHVAGERSIPLNYPSLELNPLKLPWDSAFTFPSVYNDLVIDAANEAGGHGFVTEMSDDTSLFEEQIWSSSQQDQWVGLQANCLSGNCGEEREGELLSRAGDLYTGLDGWGETVRAHVPPINGATIDELIACMGCYVTSEFTSIPDFDGDAFLTALETNVVEPLRLTQDIVTMRPHFSRHYTTLSPDEMTDDPIFGRNADLEQTVDNVYRGTMIIDCNADVTTFQIPEVGEVVASGAFATFPSFADTPRNRRVVQFGESGTEGEVLNDNTAEVDEAIQTHNAGVPVGGFGIPGIGGRIPGCSGVETGDATSASGLVAALFAFGALVRRRRR